MDCAHTGCSPLASRSLLANDVRRPLVWIPAAEVAYAHLGSTRRLRVVYSLEASRGRVLYSRDVPHNQQASAK